MSDEARTFTQDDVNAMIANEKRALTAKFDEEKNGLSAQLKDALKDSETHKGLAAQSQERIDELQKSLDAQQGTLTKYKIGLDKGLPLPIVERLQGDDEESIAADADKLGELLVKPKGEGKLPGPKAEPETEQDMNDLIRKGAGRA